MIRHYLVLILKVLVMIYLCLYLLLDNFISFCFDMKQCYRMSFPLGTSYFSPFKQLFRLCAPSSYSQAKHLRSFHSVLRAAHHDLATFKSLHSFSFSASSARFSPKEPFCSHKSLVTLEEVWYLRLRRGFSSYSKPRFLPLGPSW